MKVKLLPARELFTSDERENVHGRVTSVNQLHGSTSYLVHGRTWNPSLLVGMEASNIFHQLKTAQSPSVGVTNSYHILLCISTNSREFSKLPLSSVIVQRRLTSLLSAIDLSNSFHEWKLGDINRLIPWELFHFHGGLFPPLGSISCFTFIEVFFSSSMDYYFPCLYFRGSFHESGCGRPVGAKYQGGW